MRDLCRDVVNPPGVVLGGRQGLVSEHLGAIRGDRNDGGSLLFDQAIDGFSSGRLEGSEDACMVLLHSSPVALRLLAQIPALEGTEVVLIVSVDSLKSFKVRSMCW